MELQLYPLLSTRSRRALTRRHHRGSRMHSSTEPAVYTPRGHLIARLSRETGMSEKAVIKQLFAKREYLLSQNEE